MCACARQASAEDLENNESLSQHTPESERGGERARWQGDYPRADFIIAGGRGGLNTTKSLDSSTNCVSVCVLL